MRSSLSLVKSPFTSWIQLKFHMPQISCHMLVFSMSFRNIWNSKRDLASMFFHIKQICSLAFLSLNPDAIYLKKFLIVINDWHLEFLSYTRTHIWLDQMFLSLQAKRSVIICYGNGIYEFPHKLPNELRLRILGN